MRNFFLTVIGIQLLFVIISYMTEGGGRFVGYFYYPVAQLMGAMGFFQSGSFAGLAELVILIPVFGITLYTLGLYFVAKAIFFKAKNGVKGA